MSEISIPTFTRHYKYKAKIEDNPFIIRYLIAAELKNNNSTSPEKDVGQNSQEEVKPEPAEKDQSQGQSQAQGQSYK